MRSQPSSTPLTVTVFGYASAAVNVSGGRDRPFREIGAAEPMVTFEVGTTEATVKVAVPPAPWSQTAGWVTTIAATCHPCW